MGTLGNMVVDLGLDHRKFDRGLAKSRGGLADFADGIGSQFAGIAGGLTAAFSAGAAISAARTQEAAEQKLAAVLRATGEAAGFSAEQLKDFAAARQELTNFGDEATIDATAILATFKSIQGANFKRSIVSMQDLAATIDTDLKSAAMTLGKALNDPITGMGRLGDAGVFFTHQQKQVIAALVETGDLAGAQAVMLRELEGQMGGVAEATANPLVQVGNAFSDLVEQVGFGLQTMAIELTKAVDLKGFINDIIALTKAAREMLGPYLPLLAKAVVLVGGLAGAVLAYAAAQKVANTAAIIFQGTMNPKALIGVVAALAVAAVAAHQFAKEYKQAVAAVKEQTDAADAARAAAARAEAAVPSGPAGGSGALDEMAGQLADARRELAEYHNLQRDVASTPLSAEPFSDAQAKIRELQTLLLDVEARGVGGDWPDRIREQMEQLANTRLGELADELLGLTDLGDELSETEKRVQALQSALASARAIKGMGQLGLGSELENRLLAELGRVTGIAEAIDKTREQIQLARGLIDANAFKAGAFADRGADPAQVEHFEFLLDLLDRASADNKLAELQTEIDVATGALSKLDVQLREFGRAGAAAEQVEQFRQLTKELEGAQLAAEMRTPAEDLRARLVELKELFDGGHIDGGHIDAETLRRAELDAAKQFAQGAPDRGPAALEKGTREAFSAIAEFRRNAAADTAAADALATAKAQLAVEQEQAALLKEIAGAGGVGMPDPPVLTVAMPDPPPLPVADPPMLTVAMPDPPPLPVADPPTLTVAMPDPPPLPIADPPVLTVAMPDPPTLTVDVPGSLAVRMPDPPRPDPPRPQPRDDHPRVVAQRTIDSGGATDDGNARRDREKALAVAEKQLAEQKQSEKHLRDAVGRLREIAHNKPIEVWDFT